jgi:hypothetical protein
MGRGKRELMVTVMTGNGMIAGMDQKCKDVG